MLRASRKVAPPLKKCLCGKSQLRPLQQYRGYKTGSNAGATVGKIVGGSILFIGGGLGGTLLYAKWDPKFRKNVEKTVPYSEKVFELTLGPASFVMPPKKQEIEGPLKISTTAEVLKDSKQPKTRRNKDKEALPIEGGTNTESCNLRFYCVLFRTVGQYSTVSQKNCWVNAQLEIDHLQTNWVIHKWV